MSAASCIDWSLIENSSLLKNTCFLNIMEWVATTSYENIITTIEIQVICILDYRINFDSGYFHYTTPDNNNK